MILTSIIESGENMSEMGEQDIGPCEELLKRSEVTHVSELERDIGEIVTVALIVVLYVVCILLSVTVDLATTIESLPVLGMIGFHRREAVKAVVRKVPVPPPARRKRS